MTWDADVRTAVLDAARSFPDTEERRMFGCWCLFAHGRMVAVVRGSRVVVRLDAAGRARALHLPGATPFTPTPGRTMRELVCLPVAVATSRTRLRTWLTRAHAYAASQPKACRRR